MSDGSAFGEKVYRWYEATEFFGHKVGVTAYASGEFIVHWPVGLPGDKMDLRRFESEERAVGYALVCRAAIESLRDEIIAHPEPWVDSVTIREVLDFSLPREGYGSRN